MLTWIMKLYIISTYGSHLFGAGSDSPGNGCFPLQSLCPRGRSVILLLKKYLNYKVDKNNKRYARAAKRLQWKTALTVLMLLDHSSFKWLLPATPFNSSPSTDRVRNDLATQWCKLAEQGVKCSCGPLSLFASFTSCVLFKFKTTIGGKTSS